MSPPALRRERMKSTDKEGLRQQLLLASLLGDAGPDPLAGWLRQTLPGPRIERGLAAYRANAGAMAERALAAAYPTLQQLISEDSFAALARDFWRRHPPQAGDIALWGGDLPSFVADAPSLADEPFLADVARLEWAVHCAQTAADAEPPQGLALLAEADPAQLWVHFAAGTALVSSPHPIVTVWQAHRSEEADRFAPVRAAFAAGVGEHALVTRQGWRPHVVRLASAQADFTAALLSGHTLAQALQESGDNFDFQAWLVAALQSQCVAAVATSPPEATA